MCGMSAFDLDGTLLTSNASFAFGSYLYKRGSLSLKGLGHLFFYYSCFQCGCLSLQTLHAKARHFLNSQFTPELLKGFVRDFLSERLEALLYSPVVAHLQKAKAQGHAVAILSSSPDFLVGPIADYLGVSCWKATVYPTEGEPQVLGGCRKAEALQRLAIELKISLSTVVAYSDSIEDEPFLKIAGRAVCVRPCRRLQRVGKRRGWEIL